MEYYIKSRKLSRTIKFWKALDGHMAALELSGKTEKEREAE